MKEFELDLKTSVGIWYFSPSGGRFHDRYVPKLNIGECIEVAAEMAKYGVKGIEAHYPTEANEENLYLYRQLEKETGIKLLSTGPWIFFDKTFEFGALSSQISKNRIIAQQTLINNLKFVKESELSHCGIWPGIDGYTYPLGTYYYNMWDVFEKTVAEAMDEVPLTRIALEPKPYEPIPNNIYRTTADGLIAAHDIELKLTNKQNRSLVEKNIPLVGMQPEIGHIRMGYEDTPYTFNRITREGRLFHTHWNSQPLGNYDQDLNVGVVEWQQAEAALYALKMCGYNEYFGIDINPERMPVQKAIEINSKVLEIMNERINALPHERIIECYFNPENHRGELELILAEHMRRS
jgi:xylose isomerase